MIGGFYKLQHKIIKARAQNVNSTPNLCVIYNMLSKYTRKCLVNVCDEKELYQQRHDGNSKGNLWDQHFNVLKNH